MVANVTVTALAIASLLTHDVNLSSHLLITFPLCPLLLILFTDHNASDVLSFCSHSLITRPSVSSVPLVPQESSQCPLQCPVVPLLKGLRLLQCHISFSFSPHSPQHTHSSHLEPSGPASGSELPCFTLITQFVAVTPPTPAWPLQEQHVQHLPRLLHSMSSACCISSSHTTCPAPASFQTLTQCVQYLQHLLNLFALVRVPQGRAHSMLGY